MTPYTKLQFHLERHMYKRGQFKGDAPADQTNRGKNHLRVTKQGDNMCVRMYNTNIITVTPDNKVTISMGGWWTSTTKANLNECMWRFLGWGSVGNSKVFSYNQMCIITNGKKYKFYDGMEFDAEGALLSPAQGFERKRTDRDETAEFRADMLACGFKDVWPVLFSAAEPRKHWKFSQSHVRKVITQEHHANEWAELAEHVRGYYDDHKAAMQSIVRQCTRDMTEIVRTDVTVL